MHQGLLSGRKIESMLCTEVKISGSLPNLELYIYGLSSAFCDKYYAFIDRASYHCYQEAFFRMVFKPPSPSPPSASSSSEPSTPVDSEQYVTLTVRELLSRIR